MDHVGLYERIAAGEEEAFAQFYEGLLPSICSYIFKMVKSDDAMEEVLQEALIRFWLNRDKLFEIKDPKAWFFKIVANECYRFLKNRTSRPVALDLDRVHIGTSSTDSAVAFREIQQLIAEAVQLLSPRQQMVFQLSREKGRSLEEIAEELGLARDYVKKVLMTALEKIRIHLRQSGHYLAFLLFFTFFFLSMVPRINF